MRIVEALGIVLGVAFAGLLALFVRRLLISRGGSVEVSVRISRSRTGRGWALGLAQFAGDTFSWYRMFSFSPRPRLSFTRQELEVLARREATESELIAMTGGALVLECRTRAGRVDLAMTTSALTGFLSWLESAAPGTAGYPPHAA